MATSTFAIEDDARFSSEELTAGPREEGPYRSLHPSNTELSLGSPTLRPSRSKPRATRNTNGDRKAEWGKQAPQSESSKSEDSLFHYLSSTWTMRNIQRPTSKEGAPRAMGGVFSYPSDKRQNLNSGAASACLAVGELPQELPRAAQAQATKIESASPLLHQLYATEESCHFPTGEEQGGSQRMLLPSGPQRTWGLHLGTQGMKRSCLRESEGTALLVPDLRQTKEPWLLMRPIPPVPPSFGPGEREPDLCKASLSRLAHSDPCLLTEIQGSEQYKGSAPPSDFQRFTRAGSFQTHGKKSTPNSGGPLLQQGDFTLAALKDQGPGQGHHGTLSKEVYDTYNCKSLSLFLHSATRGASKQKKPEEEVEEDSVVPQGRPLRQHPVRPAGMPPKPVACMPPLSRVGQPTECEDYWELAPGKRCLSATVLSTVPCKDSTAMQTRSSKRVKGCQGDATNVEPSNGIPKHGHVLIFEPLSSYGESRRESEARRTRRQESAFPLLFGKRLVPALGASSQTEKAVVL